MAGLLIGIVILIVMFGAGFSVYTKFLTGQNITGPSSSPTQQENILSGIIGKILLGPQCPAENTLDKDLNCEPKSYQTTIVVKTIDGRKVTEFNSDATGQFKVKLGPGRYWLEAAGESELPHLASTPVEVEANKFEEITLRFDTGIR